MSNKDESNQTTTTTTNNDEIDIIATSRSNSLDLNNNKQENRRRYQKNPEMSISKNKLLSSNSTMTNEETTSVEFHAGEDDHDHNDATFNYNPATIVKNQPLYQYDKLKIDSPKLNRKLKTSQSEGQMMKYVDDDYNSSDEEKVYDEDDLRFAYLGIYEKSNLGERLAQSEKDLQDQRAFLVSTFMNTYGIRADSGTQPIPASILLAEEEEEDENDPAVVLERLPTSTVLKHKYKYMKQKSRNRFNKVILAVPKTRHMQKKLLERRILSNEETQKRFSADKEKEHEAEKTIADKLKEKLNLEPVSPKAEDKPLKPMFFSSTGTGKMKFRIRTMLNNVKY